MLTRDSRLYVYGAGVKAAQAIAMLAAAQISINGIIVTDKKNNESIVFEYPLYELKELEIDDNVIVWPCMLAEREQVINFLKETGVKNIIF